MAFLYESNARSTDRLGSSRLTRIEHGSHRLLFHARQDSTFTELPADGLVSGARGNAWLVVEGFPVAETDDAPRFNAESIGRALASEPDLLNDWRGAFVALLVIPEIDMAVCHRDAVGGRTAYYRRDLSSIAVSSSAHALAVFTGDTDEHPGFIAALFALRGDRPPGRSAFQTIEELLPGETLSESGASIRFQRKAISLPPAFNGSPADRVSELRRRFHTAVRRTLPIEGPVGVMLSGGLDSGPTASVAASILRQDERELHAISWRLPGFEECDESRWIRAVATHSGIRLHEFDGTNGSTFSNLDVSASNPDYPSYNAFRPLFTRCYRQAKELGIEVLLNANAADRLYPPYNAILVDLLRRWRLAHFAGRLIREIARAPTQLQNNRALRGLASYILGRHRTSPQAPAWMTSAATSVLRRQRFDSWPPEASKHGAPTYCRTVLGLGTSGGMQHEIFMSGAYGVSRRDPFYDLDLLKFFLATPPWMLLSDRWDKPLMREAMKGVLPESVRTKGKTGLLNAFFREGFKRQLPRIRERLMDTPEWSRWAQRDFVESALSPESSEREMLVITACLGYVLWRERIEEEPFV